MERRDMAAGHAPKDALRERFAGHVLLRKRSPREEVIEILAEGLWTLICQGRGPAAGKFQTLKKDDTGFDDKGKNTACASRPSD